MMKTLIVLMLFSGSSFGVDFSQPDKKSHALLGCAGASMTRGFAVDAGSNHEALWGLAGGIGAGVVYELALSESKTGRERGQDILAASIGSILCVSVAEGFRLMVSPNRVGVGGSF